MEKKNLKYFRINWVVTNQIAIGPAPLKEHHLDNLEEEGIEIIYSLCDVKEVKIPKLINKRFTCERYALPDHRAGRIPTLYELDEASNILSDLLMKGSVFVHCFAAMERSPLLCMTWLVKNKNLTPQEALDYMMQIHVGTNPLPSQLALLKEIKKPI